MSFGKFTRKEISDIVSCSWSSYWLRPGGPDTAIQFNSASTFSGSSNLTFNYTINQLQLTGSMVVSGAISASFGPNTVGFFGTASWATNALTASFVTASNVYGPFGSSSVLSASYASASSFAITASFATTASYVTTLRAADPDRSIQFNSASVFAGSSNLTFNYTSNKIILSGSQNIVITGSDAGLQIFGDSVDKSVSTGLPFLPENLGAAWRKARNVFVPSGSYGQIWSLITAQDSSPPVFIHDITSSNGDLKFKGSIGSTSNDGAKYTGYGTYAKNLDKLLVIENHFLGNNRLYAFSASLVSAQPDNFLAPLNSAQEQALISYSCSLRANNNTGEGVYLVGNAAYPNMICYTPSASVGYYSVFSYSTSSNGPGGPGVPGADGRPSPLSASIAALSSSGLNISGAASLYSLGFYMSTFDSNTPTNEVYVDLTNPLTSSFNVPLDKILKGTYVGNDVPDYGFSVTIAGTYNSILNRIYVTTLFASNEIGVIELDNDFSPPTVLSVVTSSGILSPLRADITYNATNQDFIIYGPSQYNIIDASSTLNASKFTSPKATIPSALVNNIYDREVLPISNSYYYVTSIRGVSSPSITPASSSLYYINKIESGSGGYTVTSQSFAKSYENPQQASYLPFAPTHATSSGINKIITADRSNVGPINDPNTYDENLTTTFARAGYVYTIDTVSLLTSSVFNPYTIIVSSNGPNNLIEFRSKTGSLLSYVDPDGKFVGTASLANRYLTSSLIIYSGSSTPILMTPSASSIWFKGTAVTASIIGNAVTLSFNGGGGGSGTNISFYSGSILQTSNLESLVITGSGVTTVANGNQVTMSFTGGGGTTNPGGPLNSIQFNSGSSFSGSSNFTFISSSNSVYLTGSLFLTGSILQTGSIFLSGAISASFGPSTVGFFGTSSWAVSSSRATTASYALTASFLLGGASSTPGGANTTIQFNSSNTFSGSNNFTFNSASNQVQLTGSLIVSGNLDTFNRFLYGADNVLSIEYGNRRLVDSNDERSVDWEAKLLRQGGSVVTVDWDKQKLTTTNDAGSYITIVDWASGNLNKIDSTTSPYLALTTVDWASGYLFGWAGNNPETQVLSIDWQTRKLYDSSGTQTSIDWSGRNLYDANNNLALVYSSTGSSNGVRLYGTASLALTASFLSEAVTSASFSSTASYVNTLNQNVLIYSGSNLTIGTSSVGSTENTLILGPPPNGIANGEGGQILLQAPNSGGYTSASMFDNYQNQTRLLRGTNASSDAVVAAWDMHTKQMQIPQYNALSAFPGTSVAALGVNSNGNIITIPQGTGSYLINAQTTAAGADTTINNLTFTTNANEAWSFEANFVGQCSGTGGVRFTVVYSAVPVSSSVSYWGNNSLVSNMTSATTILTTPAQSGTMWATASPIDVQASIKASFVNGASANTVTIKIQPTNGAQTATLRAMSYLTARRII